MVSNPFGRMSSSRRSRREPFAPFACHLCSPGATLAALQLLAGAQPPGPLAGDDGVSGNRRRKITEITAESKPKANWRTLPRNVWAASLTSFFMDVSSEMVINILPLFLSNVLGVKTNIIGLIEGIAEATASLLKVLSSWLSDKLRARK